MSKTAAVLAKSPSPLEAARAEVERRKQDRDADLARYGLVDGNENSPRSRHLARREARHQALIRRAEEDFIRVEFDGALTPMLAAVKASAQEAVEAAQAAVKARAGDVEREAAAIERAKARAAALQAQIDQLADSRHKGLDAVQGALAECTRTNDQAGAAAAAEEAARIETEGFVITARLRPLQLQLDALGDLEAAAEERLKQARLAVEEAEGKLFDANLEVLAVARDEAVLNLLGPQTAYMEANAGTRRREKNLPPIPLVIGASHLLLKALGKNADEKVRLSDLYPGCDMQREHIDESIFNEDPLRLEDAAAVRARKAAAQASAMVIDFAA